MQGSLKIHACWVYEKKASSLKTPQLFEINNYT